MFVLVLKFKTNFVRKVFLKRDETKQHHQIGKSEQLLSIAEIEIVGKKDNQNGTEQSLCRTSKLSRFKNNKNVAKVKQSSKLYSLDPFVDDDQVIRVGGRHKNSSLNNICAHRILLPKNGTVTELLVRWCHGKTAHRGRDITLSGIRDNGYWIIDVNSKTKQIIFKCVRCRSLRSRESHGIPTLYLLF